VDGEGGETWIGSLRFPLTGNGESPLSPSCFTGLEAYGTYLRPVEIPNLKVTAESPVMGGVTAILGKPCYRDDVANLHNARVEYNETHNTVEYEIGLDYIAHELDRETLC